MTRDFISFHEGAVRGFLHRPNEPRGDGLVLTHGAGGSAIAPLLVKAACAFASAGFTVLRFDLPFRQQRPRGSPNIGSAPADRANIGGAVAAMRALVTGRVFMGGQSYGGRQASMLAAEDPGRADGLLLLSYPLHPPGKPQLRTAHFPNLHTPALFVHGSRDPFGSPVELRAAIALIPAMTALSIIEGAGHDLKSGNFDIEGLLLAAFQELFRPKTPTGK